MASRSSPSWSRRAEDARRQDARAVARRIDTLIGNGWLRESPRLRAGLGDPRGRSAMRKCIVLDAVPSELRELGPVAAPAFPEAAWRPERSRRVAPDATPTPPAWWEDPIAIGSMLILLPPVGLAALWTSKRYSNDARWALTVVTALMLCLATAAAVAIAAVAS